MASNEVRYYFLFLKNAVRFDYSQNLFDAKSVSVKRRLVRLKTADCGGGGGGREGKEEGVRVRAI